MMVLKLLIDLEKNSLSSGLLETFKKFKNFNGAEEPNSLYLINTITEQKYKNKGIINPTPIC